MQGSVTEEQQSENSKSERVGPANCNPYGRDSQIVQNRAHLGVTLVLTMRDAKPPENFLFSFSRCAAAQPLIGAVASLQFPPPAGCFLAEALHARVLLCQLAR
jgi:hypothetical protein